MEMMFISWMTCWVFLLLGTSAAREVGTSAAREALCRKCMKGVVAVYCCIVVSVCVIVCTMPSWVCVFQSVNIFLCLLHQLSVCLCVYFGYPVPVQKNWSAPKSVVPLFAWYKSCHDWHSGCFTHCFLQGGTTSVDWIPLFVGVLWCCIRKYCWLSLFLIAGFALTFSIHWTTITDSRGAE